MKRLLLGFLLGLIALPLTTGASGLWGGHPTTIESPFHRAWRHHQGCGSPTSGITYGYYGAAHQTFRHCTMTFSRVYVTHFRVPTAPPRPTQTPLPPVPTAPAPPSPLPSPTISPMPTATAQSAPPTNTPATSTPVPTPTAAPAPTLVPSNDPATYELSLLLGEINAERASHGYPALSLDAAMSNGVGSCMGASGHAESMAQQGTIGHWDFPGDICGSYMTAGENVGVSSGSEPQAIDTIQQGMMAEPWSPGCVGNHHCTEDNSAFTRIGLGIVSGSFHGLPAWYISEEYAG